MKKLTKIGSVLMTGAMLVSAAGCNLFGGSKIGPAALASFADNEGSERYDDADDFIDLIQDLNDNESSIKKLKNGVHATLEGKDLKNFFKNSLIGGTSYTSFSYDKTMTQATVYYIGGQKNDKKWAFSALSIQFEDAEAAEEYYDDSVDSIETGFDTLTRYMDGDTDDGEEGGIAYFIAEASNSSSGVYEGIYRDGNTVLFIISADINGKDGSKTLDSFCETFTIISPKDI